MRAVEHVNYKIMYGMTVTMRIYSLEKSSRSKLSKGSLFGNKHVLNLFHSKTSDLRPKVMRVKIYNKNTRILGNILEPRAPHGNIQ